MGCISVNYSLFGHHEGVIGVTGLIWGFIEVSFTFIGIKRRPFFLFNLEKLFGDSFAILEFHFVQLF